MHNLLNARWYDWYSNSGVERRGSTNPRSTQGSLSSLGHGEAGTRAHELAIWRLLIFADELNKALRRYLSYYWQNFVSAIPSHNNQRCTFWYCGISASDDTFRILNFIVRFAWESKLFNEGVGSIIIETIKALYLISIAERMTNNHRVHCVWDSFQTSRDNDFSGDFPVVLKQSVVDNIRHHTALAHWHCVRHWNIM